MCSPSLDPREIARKDLKTLVGDPENYTLLPPPAHQAHVPVHTSTGSPKPFPDSHQQDHIRVPALQTTPLAYSEPATSQDVQPPAVWAGVKARPVRARIADVGSCVIWTDFAHSEVRLAGMATDYRLLSKGNSASPREKSQPRQLPNPCAPLVASFLHSNIFRVSLSLVTR